MSVLYVRDKDGRLIPVGSKADPPDLSDYVRSVNGVEPDENGNVEITIPDSGGNADQGGGMSATASALLINILRNAVYSSDQSVNITALEAALASGGGGDEPDVPVDPEKTLTSISATYSGGNVPVGTSVLALTGIVVTAHYSDGSTATVTGYTLSGKIAEGSNTVTVSYGGKTTTFTVTGVAESGGDDGGETSEILYELAEATTFDGTNGITTNAVVSNVDACSFVLDFEFEGTSTSMVVIDGMGTSSTGTRGIKVATGKQAGYYKLIVNCDYTGENFAPATGGSYFTTTGKQTVRVVATKCISNTTAKACAIINGVRVNDWITTAMAFGKESTKNVIVGNSFVGTINEFKIYNRVLSDDEIEAYLA